CPDIVARDALHERVPVRAGDLELTHVGYIEHPHALAHGAVLGRDPPWVADRHLVAAERHQLGAARDVDLVQRGALGRLHSPSPPTLQAPPSAPAPGPPPRPLPPTAALPSPPR